MTNVVSAIRNTISITMFNRGLAGKIFEEVKRSGAKVVMKNNAAECVLLSPVEYTRLMDEVNDARLLQLASARLENAVPEEYVSGDNVMRELGISSEEVTSGSEVEFE